MDQTQILSKFIPKEKQIQGVTVSVVPFNGRKGLQLQMKLLKVIGPAIKEIVSEVAKKQGTAQGDKVDMDLSSILPALEVLFSSMESDEVFNLIVALFAETSINGTKMDGANFDIQFTGEYGLMYAALFFVLEVNFGNVFSMGSIGTQPQ